MSPIKVLITGEKSFVGKNLIEFLKENRIFFKKYSDFVKLKNKYKFTHLIHLSFQKNITVQV